MNITRRAGAVHRQRQPDQSCFTQWQVKTKIFFSTSR
jgi:hypothetical protein